MADLIAARGQMAMSLAFHIIFAVIGLAMPLMMVIVEFRWLRTGEPVYLLLAKRWAKGTAILFVIGLPLAYWLAYSPWRGKFLIESVVALPLVLPPTVLGFYVLVAMGTRGPLGKLWQSTFGHGLAFTFTGLVIASVLYSLPFTVQPLVASFESVDSRLLDASAVLGAGRLRTFFRVILPMSVPGVITALVLSFAHTLALEISKQMQINMIRMPKLKKS